MVKHQGRRFGTAAPPAPIRCHHCGSDRMVTEPCTKGPHYARLVCESCWRFVKFLPKPGPPPDGPAPRELLARAHAIPGPVRLRGSIDQVRWAASIRATMLSEAMRRGDADRVKVLKCVMDASYFIACSKRGFRWPALEQLSGVPEGVPREG